ncbi:MAG: DEAD/DEAH box helicase [Oscillospiraceae bacterium]|nr:DEAD/DEAH box helicase [Oscillospiraceae bacterium]
MEVNGVEVNEIVRYDALGLSPAILRALDKKGYEIATPVQAGSIPPLMEWQDVMAKAPTGTGKTFAFGIPMLEHTDPDDTAVQGVILSPTRELALQICDELRSLAVFLPGVRILCVYGGQPIQKQIDQLKRRPQIIVATPGRLMDHVKRRTIRLDQVRTVVLDECDRMLDMGFIKDVTRILDMMPNRKNLALMSATWSREVMDIAWVYQRDAVEIMVQADENNKPDIRQFRLEIPQDRKGETLVRILEHEKYERVLVFCNTKSNVERLTKMLNMRDIPAQCIHGDMRQQSREQVMAQFRKGNLRLLIATDVASRGLDIDDVDAVFNYDVPDENEYYVHRIGRTGRAKRHGVAYTFVSNIPAALRLDEIVRFTKNEVENVVLAEDGSLVPAPEKKPAVRRRRR